MTTKMVFQPLILCVFALQQRAAALAAKHARKYRQGEGRDK
jgi:hypothetical protein